MRKIILLIIAILGVLALCSCGKKSYHDVVVYEVDGRVKLFRGSKEDKLAEDMKLKSGDRVKVGADAIARLRLDDDIYTHLESESETTFETARKDRITINVTKGEMVTEVRSRLSGDESFEIRTPNTNMSIRGTVVAVRCDKNDDGGYDVYNFCLEGVAELEFNTGGEEPVELNAGEGWRISTDKKGNILESEPSDDSAFEYKDIDLSGLKGAGAASAGKGGKRNRETRFYELVSIDGHTREDFRNDPDLISDYNAYEFAEYGTGILLDFDYDEGYVQYTWENLGQNVYSSASASNPSGTMDILEFSFDPGSDIGQSNIRDTVYVEYSDDTITVTYSGGCVEVYRLSSSDSYGSYDSGYEDYYDPDEKGYDDTGLNIDAESGWDAGGSGQDLTSAGGTNYEYEIVSAYFDNGNEADYNHVTWFVSYQQSHSTIQAPIWDECEWGNAIGTEEEWLEPGFTNGELELTAYNDQGELFTTRRLRFDISGDTATIYNIDDGITYNCVLYRSFDF